MNKDELLNIFNTVIRPSVEYSSVIYNSLIPDYISDKLESVQKKAMKVIFGWNVDYQELLQNGTVESLKERRQKTSLQFGLKAAASARFRKQWFTETTNNGREVRPTTSKPYVEKICSTERSRNNPLAALTRLLNEHLSK